MIIEPDIFDRVPGVVAGFTTRHGGVSEGAFSSLNLGLSTGDDPTRVAENRRRFVHALGLDPNRMAIAGQVHGDRVLVVDEPGLYPGYDALVTRRPELVLCITAADCAVILLADSEAGVVAACHSGWRGTVADISSNTVHAMESLGARTASTVAYVSPCICVDHFEVGEEVAAQFDERYVERSHEKPHVDIKTALADQLRNAGVVRIEISDRCTFSETQDFFSHRAEKGITGRMMGFIARRP